MFDGSMLDVAIGMLLVFLVSSLMASAIVEAVGGFLHRRQKHLWDTLDLLLGNTSVKDDPNVSSIVNELYQQPFITGLVRPNDRAKFKPEEHPKDKAPLRGRPTSKTRARNSTELRRRYYGPSHIEPREFANALLTFLRTGGTADRLIAALDTVKALSQQAEGPIAKAKLDEAMAALKAASNAATGLDISAAVAAIETAGAAITSEQLRAAVASMEASLGKFLSGQGTAADYTTVLSSLPLDLQVKLGAIATATGTEFADIRNGIEQWFDRNMTAASQWYRKQTRWFLFLAGVFLAVSLNIDAVHATTTLYRDKETRTAVVNVAEQVGKATCTTETTVATADSTADTTPDTTTGTVPSDKLDVECVSNKVGGSISLPIGWTDVKWRDGWFLRLIGWLIVGASVTLGAPFWFDLLRRALSVRRTPS